ncbi:pyrimidine utilization protein D [Robbsia andropogonis]|uniref:pyrimidine utilization protein D n=1 Tax=Robbsia andropogonis TaxID=28092 RepID=UPI00046358B6|nr:pyrimidine utilization protein D [Robbsia andropogonis]MCP1118054.1 pyrimidine utilization protein D [Robbsia andropogonis]MCP1127665.1 pyrimidine utilization protein D [Robbsia andropogonis]
MTHSLHFEVHGPRDETTPVVLLSSGLGGSANYWRPQMGALREQGFQVIVYDQRGTGRSPATLPDNHTIGAMASDVIDVMEATGVASCHFVGHALGGLVGMQLALDAPERLNSLTLINAWPAMRSATRRCFDARLQLLDHAGVRPYVEAQPIFLYPATWIEAHPAQVETEVEHAIHGFPPISNMRRRIAALKAFDATEQLSSITVPTLVVAAQDDVLVPSSASHALCAGLPAATLHMMAHGGHACNITCPDAFNCTLLDFLAGLRC